MENKQTAVEWFAERLTLNGLADFVTVEEEDLYNKLKQQAKEMEKEQIINTWTEATAPDHEVGLSDAPYIISQVQKAKQYYNKTYGGDK
jgi:hypothetical protein